MGDPLQDLEEKLERLVPTGLSESGREQLEDQIDQLAAKVEAESTPFPWRTLAGLAAALTAVVGVVLWTEGQKGEQLAGSEEQGKTIAEMRIEKELRKVEEAVEDRGIVLTPNNEPMHAWGYKVRKEELIFDPESGFRVQVVSEAEEEVLTEVTSF